MAKKLTEEELKSAGEIVTAKMQEIREYALNSLTKKK